MTSDQLVRLTVQAASARTPKEVWHTAAEILADVFGASYVRIDCTDPTWTGSAEVGTRRDTEEEALTFTEAGRSVDVAFAGSSGVISWELVEPFVRAAGAVASLVGRRTRLEDERRRGTFVVELSRWMLAAAAEPEALLRYALESTRQLARGHGALVVVESGAEDFVVLGATDGLAGAEASCLEIVRLAVHNVVERGAPFLTDDVGKLDDAGLPEEMRARRLSTMCVPLRQTDRVVGALCVLRAVERDGDAFTLDDVGYVEVVASQIAGGLELTGAIKSARHAAERAVAMVDSTPFPLAVLSNEGIIRRVNNAFVDLLGLTDKARAVGTSIRSCSMVVRGGSWDDALAAASSGLPWHGRVDAERGDQIRLCDGLITPLVEAEEGDLLLALHDRTDELRAQRELVSREKLATVGELAAGVAHEVNNPLTTIRVEAQLLGGPGVDRETAKALETIISEVDRAADISRRLLRLSRQSARGVQLVQINDLVSDVVGIRSRFLSGQGIELSAALAPDLPEIRSSGSDLQQVFVNLITNAEDAVSGCPKRQIAVETALVGHQVRIRVSDSGPGVDPKLRIRIFDPFFTTKDPDKGTGLGLALCHRIVSDNGGKIWVEDGELGGATFVVELPVHRE